MSDKIHASIILASPIKCDIKIQGLPFDETSNKKIADFIGEYVQNELTRILADHIGEPTALATRFNINVRTN